MVAIEAGGEPTVELRYGLEQIGNSLSEDFQSVQKPTAVGDTAFRFTAPNAGPMTLQGTNTYVVGSEQAYVIDPGPDHDRHLSSLVDWLHATGRTVAGILLTHGHPDHALGAEVLARTLNTRIWAADTDPYPLYVPTDHIDLRPGNDLLVDGGRLQVVATPGHTPDSVSLLLDPPGIIFAGDTVLGQGSTVVAPPEGDMTSYVASLEVLRGLRSLWIAPGHGPLVYDAHAKIREYIKHRQMREMQLLRALDDMPSSVSSLVARFYSETPPALQELAGGSVRAGLQKLEQEGKVRSEGGVWSLVRAAQ